jgi:release factor glutamine methyltransferase
MTVAEAVARAAESIGRRDAETLLAHLLGQPRAWLLAHPEAALSGEVLAAWPALVARRAGHEPLQYLTGTQEFFGLPLRVTRDTLIPRPETEHLVEAVLGWVAAQPLASQAPLRVLDVGTGSGAIALALARELPDAEVTACEVSAAALGVARENAQRLGLRVRFVESDLLAALAGEPAFDVLAANPPYVATDDAATLPDEVREYEPHGALFAGEDGLAVYRRLIPQARAALRRGGLLAMEIGFGQSQALRELLRGWSEVRWVEDYAGIPRVVMAQSDGAIR